MSEQRQRVEAEAAELYKYAAVRGNTLVPKQSAIDLAQQAHVRAKTITAKQVEAAAEAMFKHVYARKELVGMWDQIGPNYKKLWIAQARAAFESVGLLIEGEDDE